MDPLQRFVRMLGAVSDRLVRAGRRRSDRAGRPSQTEDERRLDRAFAALDRSGILARQCLGTASGSSLALIEEEHADALERGESVRGFVVYARSHWDRVEEDGRLVIGFGSFAPTERAARTEGRWIGRELVVALRAEGLTVEWAGSEDDEVVVVGFERAPGQ